ncbi:MAG: hypothetical protein JO142_17500 [Burkholderiales bacterium]|nr:hypothetical protein [Burkholderiales bacterium]
MDEKEQQPAQDANPYGNVKSHPYQKQPGMGIGRVLVICLMILIGGVGLLLTMCGALIGTIAGSEGGAGDAAAGLYFVIPGLAMALLAAGVVYVVVRGRPRQAPPRPSPQQQPEDTTPRT